MTVMQKAEALLARYPAKEQAFSVNAEEATEMLAVIRALMDEVQRLHRARVEQNKKKDSGQKART